MQDLIDSALRDTAFGPAFFAMMGIVFLAGIIRGFTGFGSALLTVPALAVLYGPAQAVVIEVLIEVPVSLGLMPVALRQADRRTVLPMLGMFVLFVPFGTLLLTVTDPAHVRIAISLFVLVSVAVLAWQRRAARLITPRVTYVVGAISGTTQGLTGMAGPLFATALMARGDSSARTRANIAALAAGIIALSVASYAAFGLITAQVLIYAVLASPAIMAGVWVGAWVFARHAQRNFRPVILTFLAATALWTLATTLG